MVSGWRIDDHSPGGRRWVAFVRASRGNFGAGSERAARSLVVLTRTACGALSNAYYIPEHDIML